MTDFIHDKDFVDTEYGDPSRLAARRRVWSEFLEGEDQDSATLAAVTRLRPSRVLEIGAGWGELSDRIIDATGAEVITTDYAPLMVQAAKERGLAVALADAQHLPFADGTFDVVVANLMLYHLPDIDAGLEEIKRVLTEDGHLVASAFGLGHLKEIWDFIGGSPTDLTFSQDNGAEWLERHFDRVEVRHGGGEVTFPDHDELRRYVASTMTRRHLADNVPEFEGPFMATSSYAVFVASGSSGLAVEEN